MNDTHPSNDVAPTGTECLSSNSTLFWRVFLPIFGTVFLSGLLLTFLLLPEDELYLPFSLVWGRTVAALVWLGWLVFVRRTLWRLKRVDTDSTHLYVTDYWTTLRYPWTDVEKITESRRMGRRIAHLWLKAPGRFGRKISFLPGGRFDEWREENGV